MQGAVALMVSLTLGGGTLLGNRLLRDLDGVQAAVRGVEVSLSECEKKLEVHEAVPTIPFERFVRLETRVALMEGERE